MKRVAIPCIKQRVSAHFGHAPQFAFFDVDPATREIKSEQMLDAPPHEPGVLPAWIAENKANVILVGGIGGRACDLFAQQGIEVVAGISAEEPRQAIEAYLAGTLTAGDNSCGHTGECH